MFVCGTEFTEVDAPYHYITERLRLQEEYLKEMEEYTSNMQLSKQFNMFVGKIQDYPDSLLISLSKLISNGKTVKMNWKIYGSTKKKARGETQVRRANRRDKEEAWSGSSNPSRNSWNYQLYNTSK